MIDALALALAAGSFLVPDSEVLCHYRYKVKFLSCLLGYKVKEHCSLYCCYIFSLRINTVVANACNVAVIVCSSVYIVVFI